MNIIVKHTKLMKIYLTILAFFSSFLPLNASAIFFDISSELLVNNKKKQEQSFNNYDSFIKQILKVNFQYNDQKIAKFNAIKAQSKLTLEDFLNGAIFSNSKYTNQEKQLIMTDLVKIVEKQFDAVTQPIATKPIYIASAGAPGVGKSYFLEKEYGYKPKNAVHVDPDRVSLLSMTGYNNDKIIIGTKAAYKKWRDGSNFIANFMLIKAMTEGLNIVHGTTSTSNNISHIYDNLHKNNYKINLHILFADNSLRQSALEYRAKKEGALVSLSDAKNKSRLVFERIQDTYNKADVATIYMQPDEKPYWLSNGKVKPIPIAKQEMNFTNGKIAVTLLEGAKKKHIIKLKQQMEQEHCFADLIEYLDNMAAKLT